MVITSYGGKNVYKKNLTSSRYETPCIIKQYPVKWCDNLKKQHFKYGQAADGSTTNKLVYGSLPDEKRELKTVPRAVDASTTNKLVYGSLESETGHTCTNPRVGRYYTQPLLESSAYSKNDYPQLHSNNNNSTNMFSLEERTSAEVKKKAKEVKEIEEDRARYLKEKEISEMTKLKEKKDDLKLLMSYKEPWGKPGAGAPKSNNARTNAVQRLTDSKEQNLPLGKPGAGAPMRTDSGKLKTKTDVDPEIRFQKRERGQVMDVVCPDPKYPRENPLVTNLDILAKKTREERNVVKRDEDNPLTNNNYQYYDPFGKPGGGAPTKDNNGNIVATRTFNLVRTVQEADPMEENTKFRNKPKWDAYLKKQHLKKDGERSVDREKQQRYNEELDEIARKKIEVREQAILRERKESLKHADTWNNLWGKPGNGAPLGTSRRKKVDMFDQHVDKLLA